MALPILPYLYADPFAGASGDMFLGALVDLGYPFSRLRADVDALDLDGLRLGRRRVTRGGLSAVRISVHCAPGQPHRSRRAIQAVLRRARLDKAIRRRAGEVFDALIEVEAKIHHQPVEQVHLHEVGALDALADVVGTVSAFFHLGVERMDAGPVNLGGGTVTCAHGVLPVPAPATAVLLQGVPVLGQGNVERTTPTGAALLKILATAFGPLPPCIMTRTGYGAGRRDTEDLPNVLRLMGGDLLPATLAPSPDPGGGLMEIRCQIDDMDPRIFGYLCDRLLAAGARDVYLCPVQMKKGRPGTLIVILADRDRIGVLGTILLDETTTLGYRLAPVTRVERSRRHVQVTTPFGPVRMKVSDSGPGAPLATPEYEDCRALARRNRVPLRRVLAAAVAAWERTPASRRSGARRSSP